MECFKIYYSLRKRNCLGNICVAEGAENKLQSTFHPLFKLSLYFLRNTCQHSLSIITCSYQSLKNLSEVPAKSQGHF